MPRKSTAASNAIDNELISTIGAQDTQTDPQKADFARESPGIQAGDGDDQAAPQTGTENADILEDSTGRQAEGTENSSDPQTGTETDEHAADGHDPSRKNADHPQTDIEPGAINRTSDCPIATGDSVDGANQQTEPDSDVIEPGSGHTGTLQADITPILQTESGSAGQSCLQPDITLIHQTGIDFVCDDLGIRQDSAQVLQTGLDSSENTEESARQAAENTPETTDYQTEPEKALDQASPHEEAKAKTRRRAVKSQSGETGNTPPQTGSDQAAAAPPARRQRAKPNPVLAIDGQRTVETTEDKMRNDLLDLVESQKGRKILSGTIQGVERPADSQNISFAVIYHGAFKVIIPADEAVQPPEDFRDRSPADVMHYLVTKRLGAEVDYIVKGVDTKTGIAAASRLEAMALKRRQYYYGTDRDGNNLIYEGLSAEARVVSVIRAGIFVDLFGLEAYIPLRELSYQRLIDATAHFQSGQRVLVKILRLDRSGRDDIQVSASVKQAGGNPYEQALKRYTEGSRYVGTVSMVDTNGVFVSLDGGVDCLCPYPKRGRPPRGSRVTVRILGVNHENNRIWGATTHMTTAR